MFSKRSAINIVSEFISVCSKNKIIFEKVILFGSVVRGDSHKWSDIDVAFISKSFTGNLYKDRHLLNKIAVTDRSFIDIEPHPFTSKHFIDGDPFVDEIKRTGVSIKLKNN